ncbi:MAG: glycoside hydrolase [Deltaproteobacteria bacterium]|nr:MAG: glycoside hydrolase [Deltaproteobacteria bacterium]
MSSKGPPFPPESHVAFLWHLHQPDYRAATGHREMRLPWVRLHATRGYTDLAVALERHPGVRSTVNITCVLADQLHDLGSGRRGDRWLDLSRRRTENLSMEERIEILRHFFSVNWEQDCRRMERYWSLLHKRGRDLKEADLHRAARAFTDQELRDVVVLFNLSWMGFSARESEPVVRNLLAKGREFTEVEKDLLLDTQLRIASEVLPRWQRLAERGQVELVTSPYYHPILPLLIDTDVARKCMPESMLPPRMRRPEDARLQIERAARRHRERFGGALRGMWPPEGAVSEEALTLYARCGIEWLVTDEEILKRSQTADGTQASYRDLYQAWGYPLEGRDFGLFFRDRVLSDRIGFAYAHNPVEDAVRDFMDRCAEVGEKRARIGRPALVPVALDGDNPWENYPDSGRTFLTRLFEALEAGEHAGVRIETTTFSRWLAAHPPERHLVRLHPGSWIDASFRIWIGHEETNRAWQLIGDAGSVLDARGAQLAPENREEALDNLLAAEGSDWLWWMGDDFHTETPEIFDQLFRERLARVYELTGEATPHGLRRPVSAAAQGAVASRPLREPSRSITPLIDGKAAPYVDWQGAGFYKPPQGGAQMYRTTLICEAMYWGADLTELFLRLDPTPDVRQKDEWGDLEVVVVRGDEVTGREERRLAFPVRRGAHRRPEGRLVFGDIVEVALSFDALGLEPGEEVRFAVRLLVDGVEVERLPRYGHLKLVVPKAPGSGGTFWRM